MLNALLVPLIYFFVVETAGKSLEQIDRWFASNPSWFVDNSMDTSYIETNEDGKEDTNGAMKGLDIRDFVSDVNEGFEGSRRDSESKALWGIGDDDDDDDKCDDKQYSEGIMCAIAGVGIAF